MESSSSLDPHLSSSVIPPGTPLEPGIQTIPQFCTCRTNSLAWPLIREQTLSSIKACKTNFSYRIDQIEFPTFPTPIHTSLTSLLEKALSCQQQRPGDAAPRATQSLAQATQWSLCSHNGGWTFFKQQQHWAELFLCPQIRLWSFFHGTCCLLASACGELNVWWVSQRQQWDSEISKIPGMPPHPRSCKAATLVCARYCVSEGLHN